MTLTIMSDKRIRPRISKNDAWCVLLELPTREERTRSGLFVREIPRHWERMASDGQIIRCHTKLEAMEAAAVAAKGIAQGQFLAVAIQPYDPGKNDLPYYEWVRGIRRKKLERLGLTEDDLPETHDPGLLRMSDAEWAARGPR